MKDRLIFHLDFNLIENLLDYFNSLQAYTQCVFVWWGMGLWARTEGAFYFLSSSSTTSSSSFLSSPSSSYYYYTYTSSSYYYYHYRINPTQLSFF